MLQERARGRGDAGLLPAGQDGGRGRAAPGEQQAWAPSKLLPGLPPRSAPPGWSSTTASCRLLRVRVGEGHGSEFRESQ